MSTRREEMLKEMGLEPRWRLRAPPQPAREASEAPVVSDTPRTDALLRVCPAPGGATAMTVSTIVPAHKTPPVLQDALTDRRATIMQLDWTALRSAVAECAACRLHERRNRTVFGVGDERAEWMFVGEGPGADEDAQGEPFVGQAGKLLDNMLAAIKLERGRNVFIANVVKCRPPGNRNPEPEEAAACEPFLQRQIELIKPKLIVALGRVAALNLLAREASIASLRGRVLEYRGIPLVVTYHPAYLLRNLADKAKAWEDLCFAVRTMEALRRGEAAT